MLNALIKLFVPKLNGLLLIVALTGFVCTHKIQAEEECLSSNVLCYECDSRYDPNCADPFDFSASAIGNVMPAETQQISTTVHSANSTLGSAILTEMNTQQLLKDSTNSTVLSSETNSTLLIPQTRQPKKLPTVSVCHGCCVKITSKTPNGVSYVRRLCTTNLQINYFMVGLVCMKESGDRGKMCFCETDYCNGQPSNRLLNHQSILLLITLLIPLRILSISCS